MFGLTTRGEIQDDAVVREFERLYARLTEFLSQVFDVDGNLIREAPFGVMPVGGIVSWGSDTPPSGWLLLDGSQKSRVTYKALFEKWGTTYGVGDGSTTFNLPDTRGRFILGKAVSATGSVLGEIGGSLDHTHSVAGMSVSGSTNANGGHSHSGSGSTSTNGSHAHSQGAHSHALFTVGALDTDGNAAGASVAGQSSQTDIFNDSGTSANGDHSHSVSISTDSVGDHVHTFSASVTGGDIGTANPAYIVFNQIVYAGVA